MAPKIERILENFKLGEGPHWDVATQSLYFVDVNSYTIHRYVPSTKKHTSVYLGKNCSIIIPVKGRKNQFIVTMDREIVLITWDGESDKLTNSKVLYEVDKDTPNVFNDGKADSLGRLWTGTMGNRPESVEGIPLGKGTLYSFKDNIVTPHRRGIGISNGIAFDDELKKMYYVDSRTGTVDAYDIDIDAGTISNCQPIFTATKHGLDGGLFDGITIDTDGNLYVAVAFKHRIIKIDPRRPETLLDTIMMPTKLITSVCFGGENLDELWVTSAILSIENPGPMDGALYRVTGVNAKGLPGNEVVL